MITHQMKLREKPFNNIKNGTKVIELRLYDEKRKLIKVGDEIEFSKDPELTEKVLTKVEALYVYPTFNKMFEDFAPELFACSKKEDLINSMYKYYSKEDEELYGAVGIKIKLID